MELTLTGASLNSDHGSNSRQRQHQRPASASASASNLSQHQPQCNSSHCQSNTNTSTSANKNKNTNTNAKAHNHSHGHGHGHGNDKKKCCENHSHSHGHNHTHSHSHSHNHNHAHNHANAATNTANPYVDVRSIPKEKLTSNPAVLMNAVIASVRGRGSFDTFCYLVDLVLDHERSLGNGKNSVSGENSGKNSVGGEKGDSGNSSSSGSASALMKEENTPSSSLSSTPVPMKWGNPPPLNLQLKKNHGHTHNHNQQCNSCLNNYTTEGHTLAHWCAKRIVDGSKYLQYLVDNVPYIELNLPSRDAVGMAPIHWSCTEGSIPNVAFLLSHYDYDHDHGNDHGNDHDHGRGTSKDGGGNSTAGGTTTTKNASSLVATDDNTNNNKTKTKTKTKIDILNTLDASKCTPLLIASQYGHADLVAFLIKRGADPYAIDNAGDTAFHWAAYKGSVPVCALLLHLHCYHQKNADANVNASVNANATLNANENVSGGCNNHKNKISDKYDDYESGDLYGYMDLQDNFGQCPLHLASLRGNIDVVSYLLEEAEQFVERKLHSRSMTMNVTAKHKLNLKDGSGSGSNNTNDGANGGAAGVDVETGLGQSNNNNNNINNISNETSQSLLANDYNNNNNNKKNSFNVQYYPATLLNMKDKNNKTPMDLAIKKKQKPTELLLRKYMDKHNSYNQSTAFGKIKMSMVQFCSVQNWLLWMGLMSEGGGRPPKFILWFVVGNLFLASCIEAFVYAPVLWMKVLGEEYMDVNHWNWSKYWSKLQLDIRTSEEMVRLSSDGGYVGLHCATWFFFAVTWITLYLVNQTDPGILITSSAIAPSSVGMGMGMAGDVHGNVSNLRAATSMCERVSNWFQLLIRRLCSFIPWLSSSFFARDGRYSSVGSGSSNSASAGTSIIGCGAISKCTSALSSWLCCCFGIGNENRRIKREMHSLSIELRRKYDDKLESFASSTESSSGNGNGNGKNQLCHSCHIVRPLRSKHCRVLNRCILLFDHHCPFVGTTIGLYNYKYFYLFIWAFTVADILFTTTGFLHWKHGMTAAAAAISTDAAKESMEIGTLMVIIYFSMYTVMTGGLSIYHTQLIWNNLTTNEHQNLHKYHYLKKQNADGSVSLHNPFNKGFLRNLMSRFAPGRDSYVLEEQDPDHADGRLDVDGKKKVSAVEMMPSSNKKSDDNRGGEKMDFVSNMV